MKVLLVNPPLKSSNPYEPAPFPLGLGYLAASLRQADHEPILLDACLGPARRAPHSHHYDIGLAIPEIVAAAQKAKPDLLGVAIPFTSRLKAAVEIGQALKSAFPHLPLVAGGLHATVAPQDLLNNGFDAVILGEAEWSFPAYLKGMNSGQTPVIPDGMAWREKGQIHILPQTQHPVDLDHLPFPARDLVDFDAYLRRSGGRWVRTGARMASVLSSRGCPYRCTYCSAFRLVGRKYRRRSPQSVLDEIELLLKNYRLTHVAFEDDNLTADRQRAKEIFEGMLRRFPRLKWLTPNGVSIRNLDRELLAVMKRCGCKAVNLAFESGDEHILHDVMKKDHEPEEGRQARAWCRELGIGVNGCFVLGMPGETIESMQRSLDYAISMDLDGIGIFIATPFPGTELYDLALEKGYLDPAYAAGGALFASDPDVLHQPLIETPWLSKTELMAFAERFGKEFIRHYNARRPLMRFKRAAASIVRRVLPR
jgi:magnesium-protoporphyrin IX monomethyl ester (oxidative) cyclase